MSPIPVPPRLGFGAAAVAFLLAACAAPTPPPAAPEAVAPAAEPSPAIVTSAAGMAPALADPVAEGRALADGFFAALQSGDPTQVAAVLAPQARIARANGDVVARDDYLGKLPVIKDYALDQVAAVQSGDALVVTYHVLTDELINGVQQPTKEAPRLTVFQWQDGAWKLLAHANFNAINGPEPTP